MTPARNRRCQPRSRGLPIAALACLLGLLLASPVAAVPERRRDFENRRANEYLVVPAVASLPGVGVFAGIIASSSNLADTGVDVAATGAESIDDTDIGIRAVALRDVPLLLPGLVVDYQYADLRLGNFQTYLAGRNSPNFTVPITARFQFQLVRPVLRLWERRFNLSYSLGYFEGFEFDEEGNEFRLAQYSASVSLNLDYTDDVVDPYTGTRFFYSRSLGAPTKSFFGETVVAPEASLNEGDDEIVSERVGFTLYSELIEQRLILAWDTQFFQATGNEDSDEVVAGGSLPLRGYPDGRWSDRYGFFSALELRYNLPVNKELDVLLAKGTLVAHQFAVFHEQGQVSPKNNSLLFRDLHRSSGAGYRVLLEAIVLRLDFAASDEGLQTHLTAGHHF